MNSTIKYSPHVTPTEWHDIDMVDERLLSPEEFKSAMDQIGAELNHSLHPYHHYRNLFRIG